MDGERLYFYYLRAYGQARSGNEMCHDDYQDNPGEPFDIRKLNDRQALATTLGIRHGCSDLTLVGPKPLVRFIECIMDMDDSPPSQG